MRGMAGSVCDVPMVELRNTANMIQKSNALNPILYPSILMKVVGWIQKLRTLPELGQ